MKEDKLIALLDSKIKGAVGADDSPMSKERTDIQKYYKGDEPKPYHKGNSKFVSLDVYDTVESMKAQMIETFAAGDHIVRFAAQGPDDVELAEVGTQYCDYVVHRQNDGFNIYTDVLHDGLMGRVGVVKVYWQDKKSFKTEKHEDLNIMEFDALLAEDNVELVSYDINYDTETIKAKFKRVRIENQIVIDNVPPEEFLIEKGAVRADKAFLGHRTKKTYAELVGEGYDEKLLDKIDTAHSDCLDGDAERQLRHLETSSEVNLWDDKEESGKGAQKYYVTECYPILDMEDEGYACRWKIIKVANVILYKEEVFRHPFHFFSPLRLPHVFWGDNFATKAKSTQNAKTVLTRSILDHTVITNNPRWMVVKGALPNPTEMIDNRVGGLVNVSRPDGLSPLPQQPLNPYVFDAIKLVDEGNEGRTGMSRLSQGLNKDALSKQNSQGMVEQLTSMSQIRQKVIARNFAINFLRPLYLHIYELVLEKEDRKKVFEVAGNFIEIDPSTWAERKDVTVEFRLGYGERDKDAEGLMMIYQMFSQDPAMSPMFQDKHRHALLMKVFSIKGHKDAYKYLARPEEVKPPQPDPLVIAQLEIEKERVGAATIAAKTAQLKVQLDHDLKMKQLELESATRDAEMMLKGRDQARKEFETEHRAEIAEEELKLAKSEAAKAAETQTRTIISPDA